MAPLFSFYTVLHVFALFSTFTFAAASVCTQKPYAELLPLSNWPAAEAFCTSKFPLTCPKVTTTFTSTSTGTVTMTVATVTTTTDTTTVTTTVATNTVTSTTATISVTATSGTVTAPAVTVPITTTTTVTLTITNTNTNTQTATTTTTITVTSPPSAKRSLAARDLPAMELRQGATVTAGAKKRETRPEEGQGLAALLRRHQDIRRDGQLNNRFAQQKEPRAPTTTPKPPSTTPKSNPTTTTKGMGGLLSSLESQALNFISTVCSCIEAKPTCTTASTTSTVSTTVTTSVTATSSVRATSTTSVTATSTTLIAITVTATVPTTVTPTVTTTNTVSQTTSVTTVTTTTTTTTTTVTSTVTVKPTPVCTPGSTCSNGNNFFVSCGSFINNSNVPGNVNNGVTTNAACLQLCSNDAACNAFNFDSTASTCTLYDNDGNQPSYTNDPYSDNGYYYGSC